MASPGCGAEGRVGCLVGVVCRRVALPIHRIPSTRCVGVEAVARDGEHAIPLARIGSALVVIAGVGVECGVERAAMKEERG